MSDKQKALVICRTPAGRMYLGVLLNRIWYTPIFAESTSEADTLVKKHALSVILLDGDIPDNDRDAAVSFLRNDPALKDLPLLVVFSTENNVLRESLISKGCADVIQKPIDLSQLYSILCRLSDQPRQTPRVPLRTRVEIGKQTQNMFLTSVDISEGGIYLRTYTPIPENTTLRLSFTLPHDASRISVVGEVVRNIPLGLQLDTEPGIGLRFVGISEEARGRIRDFVKFYADERSRMGFELTGSGVKPHHHEVFS